jgi:DNA-binding transcriptional ArsR family regulator
MSVEYKYGPRDLGDSADLAVSRLAAAIGEPARARMLFALMDDHARTSTELATIANISASTASVHLARLVREGLVTMLAQGKHHYYRLAGADVARALESLRVVTGARTAFVPRTPSVLRIARTCYDHIAGTIGVVLHDRMLALGWLERARGSTYAVTPAGDRSLGALGIEVDALAARRRKLAFGCLDWSERRHHLGGALAAALLETARRRRWVTQERDSRALAITALGRRELRARFGIT